MSVRTLLSIGTIIGVLVVSACSYIQPVGGSSPQAKSATPEASVESAAPMMLAETASPTSCQVGTFAGTEVKRVVKVNMVALNQPIFYNRLGAWQDDGMMFALARDIEFQGPATPAEQTLMTKLQNGEDGDFSELINKVRLRTDKRPRPIVLRANVKDCLDIHFTNLLSVTVVERTNHAGVHIQGTMPFSQTAENPDAIKSDGAFVGKNPNNLAAPGETRNYDLYVPAEGAFVLNSAADNFSQSLGGQLIFGLFGALNVQPEGSEYYRSQVTKTELASATQPGTYGAPRRINYAAMDGGVPVLSMLKALGGNTYELVYTDPTAIVTGPNAGPLANNPDQGGQYPQSLQPYREFNIMYHEITRSKQAFRQFDPRIDNPAPEADALGAGGDFFAINYGSAGIGAEIWANRVGVGPMKDCVTCAYEEFFLSSWTVGDPAMVVDTPAKACVGKDNCGAQKALYPDDPSNVYHSYMSDHVRMRVHHGAGTLHHLHHLHAHQWLHSPKSAAGHYLDSQLIGPGSSFTLDMVYNGSGNRNQTVGDSIFHCHFYPHFAEGMWSLWRVHDVFEEGTELDADGKPATNSRALPDGEIVAGTPIPAVVPLPTVAMAPDPSDVWIEDGQVTFPNNVTSNPGYPFFIPGIAGERAPHPPMDFTLINGTTPADGGLPRHVVHPTDGTNGYDPEIVEYHNRFDFSKFAHVLEGSVLPEEGTAVEKVAMRTHATRQHASFTPDGTPKPFILNGLPAIAGAPYADPCALNSGSQNTGQPTPVNSADQTRNYYGVDMQMDVVLNKKGWHYSQQRFGVLWQDLIPTLNKERPPEPLFFRANSGDCVIYNLANVIPEYYELDDFQVRTPTDVLGQHIHLVKFDVTSSDGGANGFNYEDGTFAPQTVVERLKGFKKGSLDGYTGDFEAVAPEWLCANLSGSDETDCMNLANTDWLGAQSTVQRWFADPQLAELNNQVPPNATPNNDPTVPPPSEPFDRTLRTVFTHDHFSPSTHQQAGLYMGLLVEPPGSTWKDSETGTEFYTRADGGPTSWQAIITTDGGYNQTDSYREFMFEFQDFQLAYQQDSAALDDYPEANESTPFYGNTEDHYLNVVQKEINSTTVYNTVVVNADGSTTTVSGPSYNYVNTVKSLLNYSGYLDPKNAINPPQLQAGEIQPPTLISSTPPFALGTYSVNYRNEPLPLRIWDPSTNAPSGNRSGNGDMAWAYASMQRADSQLNTQPVGNGFPSQHLTAGAFGNDPFTPIARVYQGDQVQVRTLVGAHLNMHNFSMQGFHWLFEPSNTVSGIRSSQPMGISEHFELNFQVPISTVNTDMNIAGEATTREGCEPGGEAQNNFADYLYMPSSEENGQMNGNWGLFRAYLRDTDAPCLQRLPTRPKAQPATPASCPANAPNREFNVVAATASMLHGGQVVYSGMDHERIADKQALVYVGCDASSTAYNDGSTDACTIDNLMSGLSANTENLEPFVLRAAAGECITVNLANWFARDKLPGQQTFSRPREQNALLQFRYEVDQFPANCTAVGRRDDQMCCVGGAGNQCCAMIADQRYCDMAVKPSSTIGMTPQLVAYDMNSTNGTNVGYNTNNVATLGQTQTYKWYAGERILDANGNVTYRPVEFGAANLFAADPIIQSRFGMLAGMVIEPEGACWSAPDGSQTTCATPPTTGTVPAAPKGSITGTQVTVHTPDDGYFQENVVIAQDNIALAWFTNPLNYNVARMGAGVGDGLTTNNPAGDTGLPFPEGRGRYTQTVPLDKNKGALDFVQDMACGYSNVLGKPYPNAPEGTPLGDPEAPIFYANPGDAVRFRVMQAHGADQHTFELFGHAWQEEPYTDDSRVIGDNPESEYQGSRMGLGATDKFDIVIAKAGGNFSTPGDYLFRSYPGGDQTYGMWGLLRVGDVEDAYQCGDDNKITRPMVCVPQFWVNNTLPGTPDLNMIYANKEITQVNRPGSGVQRYRLPAGCTDAGSGMVECACGP